MIGKFNQNYFSILFTIFIPIQCKSLKVSGNVQPLWINTTHQAFESGVDVVRIQREFCAKNKMPEVYYINYDNVEPLFGLEIAEDLIRNFSFVAINFEVLCQEFAHLQTENEDLDWHLQNYQIQRQLHSQHDDELQSQLRDIPNSPTQRLSIPSSKSEKEENIQMPLKSESDSQHDDELQSQLREIPNIRDNPTQHSSIPISMSEKEQNIQIPLKGESANIGILNGIHDRMPPQLPPLQLDEQSEKEEILGAEVKLEAESEAELKIQQKLGEELGKKIDVDKPLKISESDSKHKEGSERGPIGIDVSALDRLNIESLEKALRGENDTEINEIFKVFAKMRKNPERQKLFASTNIIPLMKRVKYDPRTAPTLLEDQTVTVRVGIHVQSLSNFQLTTMDYDMDLWLRMCWRDPRLAHGLNAPILITEESFLRRIWRPDAFFVNSVDSLFHRVTYLNFYMFVFPEGEVFFEARLYLKPKSLLVLCKYPHDSQIIYLRISSRNYTCIEARFYMKRNLGYYLAQTYVPTATCVLFSWISVWLPEEFVEGRIFVALTVFLTLSAESNAAKEILPKVSYVKAIDIWFGFTALFVFSTMLQALIVISLENMSKKLKKIVEEENDSLSVYKATRLLLDSKRYHKWGRGLDEFFKVMYPVILIIFLFIYIFVIIEGDENKCLRGTEMDRDSHEL